MDRRTRGGSGRRTGGGGELNLWHQRAEARSVVFARCSRWDSARGMTWSRGHVSERSRKGCRC